jgi:hypothetical protein
MMRVRWPLGGFAMNTRSVATVAIPIAGALLSLAALHWTAPAYLFRQGFPLDDAWIHAVYAREFARSGMLAYNPGVPATGETSPLWAIVLALPHWWAGQTSVVGVTKLVGWSLHAASAVLMALAVRVACDEGFWLGPITGTLVALHPDLLAASTSGMEVPLATAIVAAIALAGVRAGTVAMFALSAAAFAGRPETAAFAVLFPAVYWSSADARVGMKLSAAAAAGVAASVTAITVRNLLVSGLPMPATFYVKAAGGGWLDLQWEYVGFTRLLGSFPLLGAAASLAATAMVIALLTQRPRTACNRLAVALYLCGLTFCAVSFALVHPADPTAFYHQRYALPALAAIVGSIPLLVHESARALRLPKAGLITWLAACVMAATLIQAAPARYRRLANDAQNIDDVQVAFGKALASASPRDAAWVVDAGAPRYFGRAFVVDLMALNTFQLLSSEAQVYLDQHPPRYLDAFREWSAVAFDGEKGWAEQSFTTSTPYTVTTHESMRTHTLVSCVPGARGRVLIRQRTFAFRCGGV